MTIQERFITNGVRTVVLENDILSVTLLPDKGADIYSLIYKPKGVDILWKTSWGVRPPGKGFQTSLDSEALWMEYYPGGWQLIFPNGGNACRYKGVELNFHGEASTAGWNTEVLKNSGEEVEVEFSTRLFKSPFRIRRRIGLKRGSSAVSIREKITNEGKVLMDCMWGHHPAYGSPFIDGPCTIRTGAGTFITDESCTHPRCPVDPGKTVSWPRAPGNGGLVDVSTIPPGNDPRYIMGYLADFDKGWYEIENSRLGLTFRLSWDERLFPYAWYWQEINSTDEYPWYGDCRVTAIEPFSSYPGFGLSRVMEETGTQLRFEPGESKETELTGCFIAV